MMGMGIEGGGRGGGGEGERGERGERDNVRLRAANSQFGCEIDLRIPPPSQVSCLAFVRTVLQCDARASAASPGGDRPTATVAGRCGITVTVVSNHPPTHTETDTDAMVALVPKSTRPPAS